MASLMMIGEFSERTGISSSTLRYYEEDEQILLPVRRNPNGYRLYNEEQIELAKLIHSLRLANVPLKEIRAYLKAEPAEKQNFIGQWKENLVCRMALMQTGYRYLSGYDENSTVYLLEKNHETIVWFTVEAPEGKFGDEFSKKQEKLRKQAIPFSDAYLRYLSGNEIIKAEIGFAVDPKMNRAGLPDKTYIEQLPACLCLALPYREELSQIHQGYQQLIEYVAKNGWTPAGSVLEWYRDAELTDLDLILPVTQVGRKEKRRKNETKFNR
ncbi:MAG TPA: MerR family transcriptional regulator [Bacillales bacterium]